jgi:hypothetical protein
MWHSMNEKSLPSHTDASYEDAPPVYPPNPGQKKNEQVIHALKSLLPPPETLFKIIDQNKVWWKNITTAMVGPGGTPKNLTDIHVYAEYALTLGTPMDVAKILHMAVTHEDLEEHQIERILDRIDQLIISDDEYMGTLAGVEVAQQQARHLGDFGQSRRAWLVVRRAVSFAQLMGLNRTRVNVRQDLAFWGLYQFDRFCSLILGVPYSLADVHCNLTFRARSLPIVWENHHFMTHLAILAGKVIDMTHGPVHPASPDSKDDEAFQRLVAIDDELVALKTKMSPGFWQLEPKAPKDWAGSTAWMQTSLSLIMWNQTRLILHLPHLFRSSGCEKHSIPKSGEDNSKPDYSRNICLEISRSTLSVFQILRHKENSFAFKTMAIDFMSVITAVVLVIDVLTERNHAAAMSGSKPVAGDGKRQSDWDLLQTALDIYEQAEKLPFNKIALQARKVLAQLLDYRDPKSDLSEANKIMIPFFGTITIHSGYLQEVNIPSAGSKLDITLNPLLGSGALSNMSASTYSINKSNPSAATLSSAYAHSSMSQPSQSPSSTSSPHIPLLHTSGAVPSNLSPMQSNSPTHFGVGRTPTLAPSIFEQQVSYDGVYMHYENNDFVTSGWQGMSSRIPSSHLPTGWQNVGTFDLDQDWNWLMGESGHAPGTNS